MPKKEHTTFWGWCSHAIISHCQGITDYTEHYYGFSFETSKMYDFQQSAPNSEQLEHRLSHHMENHCTTPASTTPDSAAPPQENLSINKRFSQDWMRFKSFELLEKSFFNACRISWKHLNRYQHINGSGCLILDVQQVRMFSAELHCSGIVLLTSSWVWRLHIHVNSTELLACLY